MSVLYILRIKGDPAEIAAKVAEVSEAAWEVIVEHGFLGETLGGDGNGVVIAEVWESEQGYRDALAHPTVAAEFQRVALPPVEVNGPYPVARDFWPGR